MTHSKKRGGRGLALCSLGPHSVGALSRKAFSNGELLHRQEFALELLLKDLAAELALHPCDAH